MRFLKRRRKPADQVLVKAPKTGQDTAEAKATEVKAEPKKGCRSGCTSLITKGVKILLVVLLVGLVVGVLGTFLYGKGREVVQEVQQELSPHGELSIVNSDGSIFDSWEINLLPENVLTLVDHPAGAVIMVNTREIRFAQGQQACLTLNLVPSTETRGSVRDGKRCFSVADVTP